MPPESARRFGVIVRLRQRKARAATLLGALVRGHQLRRRLWYYQILSRHYLSTGSDLRGQAANTMVVTHDVVVGKVRQARRMTVAARQTVAIALAATRDDLKAIFLWAARRPMTLFLWRFLPFDIYRRHSLDCFTLCSPFPSSTRPYARSSPVHCGERPFLRSNATRTII